MKKDLNRVIFYSKQDLSGSRNLQNAERIIKNFNSDSIVEINDIIELYQIKLYFDNDLYLNEWSFETKAKYIKTVNSFWNVITASWNKINDKNILKYFQLIDYQYHDSFWILSNKLNTYKRITSQSISRILKNDRFNIREFLKQKSLVNYFFTSIKDYLINSEE